MTKVSQSQYTKVFDHLAKMRNNLVKEGELSKETGLSRPQVRTAISYINRAHILDGMNYVETTLNKGEIWYHLGEEGARYYDSCVKTGQEKIIGNPPKTLEYQSV